MDHARSGSGGGLPPQLDPGFLEQMSRAQSSGQFFPGDLRLQPQPSNLREHEYAVGGSQLNMPPLGPAYLPQPANLAHAYGPMDHARTEQQLAELFSSQLDLFGPPLGHPLYRHAPSEEQYLGDGCSGPQGGEEKPRSKMQEKNRRVSDPVDHSSIVVRKSQAAALAQPCSAHRRVLGTGPCFRALLYCLADLHRPSHGS